MPLLMRSLLSVSILLATSVHASTALDVAFEASPREMLDAAAARPSKPGDDVAIVLEEMRLDFAEDASERRVLRLIYRVLDADGVRDWGSVTARWEPWRSERPQIRARVIAPDGSVKELQQSHVDEGPVHDAVPDVLTSGRRLRAPLPSLRIGSVVEYEVTWSRSQPVIPGISSGAWFFGMGLASGLSRVILTAPESLSLRDVPRLVAAEAGSRRVEDGRSVITWTRRDIPAARPPLLALPSGTPRWERVSWTTASSWDAVAEGYSAVVERVLAGTDVSAEAKAAAGDATDMRTAAARCLTWIHERVRYTGLAFGEAAIVPATPATCLARGFGDCKDKATLFVAMMRSLGHRADVVLVRPGFSDEDIDPGVPGIGSFTHAIAAIGEPPVFVDVTVPEAAFGELPLGVPGRLALIARRGIADLTRIPAESPETDRVLETVTVRLAEEGPGSLTELTESWGPMAVESRAGMVGTTQEELEKRLADWCRVAWLAEAAESVEASSAADLSAPTTLSYRAVRAGRAVTEYPHAYVGAVDGDWINHLAGLIPVPDADAGDETREREAREALRTEPAQLPRLFRWERVYRIEPPPGWEVSSIPEAMGWAAGPVSYAMRAAAEADGTVSVNHRFDTGNGKLTAAEFRELRKHVAEHREADGPVISFQAVSDRLLGEGDIKGALAEHRKLSALHPTEALHLVHLSSTLLGIGLGDAARKAAGDAIRAEPSAASGHVALARALTHDSFGRPFKANADLAAALSSAREAVKVDPENIEARTLLAALLSLDDHGGVNWDPTASRQAAAAWAEVVASDSDASAGSVLNLIFAHFRAGDVVQMRQALQAWQGERTLEMDALDLATTAIESGLQAGLKLAATPSLRRHDRANLLQLAATTCMQSRSYELAADLLIEAARGSALAAEIGARADLLRAVQRVDPAAIGQGTPESAARRAFALIMGRDVASIETAFASDPLLGFTRSDLARGALEGFAESRQGNDNADMPPAVMRDLVCSSIRASEQCDGAGRCRVLIRLPNPAGTSSLTAVMRQEGDAWGITMVNPDVGIAGQFALDHAKAGRLEAARHWLDWAYHEGIPADSGKHAAPIWRAGQEASGEEVRRAATFLAALSDASGNAASELNIMREAAITDEERESIDRRLFMAHASAKRHAETARVGMPLIASELEPSAVVFLTAGAVRAAGNSEATQALAAQLMSRWPEAPMIAMYQADVLGDRGDFDGALALMRSIEDSGRAGDLEHHLRNHIAWFGLIAGEPAASLLGVAREGAAGPPSAARLHTLACVLAEAERPLEALQTLVRSMNVGASNAPRRHDHHVLGRIAESYGEIDAARASYEKARSEESKHEPADVAILASRRLQALDSRLALEASDGAAGR